MGRLPRNFQDLSKQARAGHQWTLRHEIADHLWMPKKARPRTPRRGPMSVQVGEPFSSREQIASALGGTGWRGIDYLTKTRHAVLIASDGDAETYSDSWDADGQ